jgi:hypothetical protein
MAMRVLSQVVNTSSAKRCWSTYSFIHNVRRNRLNVQRAETLVYVHYNLQLLNHYCEDPTIDKANKMWDYNPGGQFGGWSIGFGGVGECSFG